LFWPSINLKQRRACVFLGTGQVVASPHIEKKSIKMNIFPKWGENKGCLKLQLAKSYQFSMCMGMERKTYHIYPSHCHVPCIIITVPNAEKTRFTMGNCNTSQVSQGFTREQVKWSKHGHKLPH